MCHNTLNQHVTQNRTKITIGKTPIGVSIKIVTANSMILKSNYKGFTEIIIIFYHEKQEKMSKEVLTISAPFKRRIKFRFSVTQDNTTVTFNAFAPTSR